LRYLLAGTPAKELQPGDLLRGDDGQLYPVESVKYVLRGINKHLNARRS
jgi:hypothetical protein